MRNDLTCKYKREFKAIDIVYEPSFEKDKPVLCSFIHIAYKSYIGHMENGREKCIIQL